MNLKVAAEVVATLTINQKEAEALEYITSYDCIKECTTLRVEEFTKALKELRGHLHVILAVAEKIRTSDLPTTGGMAVQSILRATRNKHDGEHTTAGTASQAQRSSDS